LRQRDADRDALMMVASCSKRVTATLLAMLAERGELDIEAPVAQYWPEFAANGKAHTTVGMVASHTAGLPYPPLGSGLTGLDLHRGPAVTALLAGATPLWEPGTAMVYHPVMYGTLLDEIVRRATGHDLAHHLRELIAGPLGLDLWFGAPDAVLDRIVPDHWDPAPTFTPTVDVPGSYADFRQRALAEEPPMAPDLSDPVGLRAQYQASRPAVGAVTDARSLARMYAAVIGEVDGIRLVSDSTLVTHTRPRTDELETLIEAGTVGPDIRFGVGYQLASGSMPGFGLASFGHTGAGGRLAIADPSLGVSFGFVCSRMRPGAPTGDPRWAPLVAAVARVVRG
jgi:CubicO group peptidase (beta-lactamase class C family)